MNDHFERRLARLECHVATLSVFYSARDRCNLNGTAANWQHVCELLEQIKKTFDNGVDCG